jgi:predicted HicB family RNase H-like nuclease
MGIGLGGGDMSKEKRTAIIAMRVSPSVKRKLVEKAVERGWTLTEYIIELLVTGWEQINKEEGVKRSESV